MCEEVSVLLSTFANVLVHVMRIGTLGTFGAKFPSGNDMRDIKNMHLDEITLKSRVVQIWKLYDEMELGGRDEICLVNCMLLGKLI